MDDTFLGLDNKTYVLSPITLGDTKKLIKFVRYRAWTEFQDMKNILEPEQFRTEADRLLKEANSKPIDQLAKDVDAIERSPEGAAYTLYLSLAHRHPNIKPDDVFDLVTLPMMAEISQKLAVVSGFGSKKKEPESQVSQTLEKSTDPQPK